MEERELCAFFSEVLQWHMKECNVNDRDMKKAVYDINSAYSKEGQRMSFISDPVDYNSAANRCAYLHKYAGCHAAMVHHILSYYLKHTVMIISIPRGVDGVMNICCLGGGPGSDICGLSSTLLEDLDVRKFRLTTIDRMKGWKHALDSVFTLGKLKKYNDLRKCLSRIESSTYIYDDLTCPGSATIEAVESAHLVTMIKFVSAVNQHKAKEMLQVLFSRMKLGAVVLFIDNGAGGFYEKVSEAASECGLEMKCDAFQHVKFECEGYYRYGSQSLSCTRVTVQMWKKSYAISPQQEESVSEEIEDNNVVDDHNEIGIDDWDASSIYSPYHNLNVSPSFCNSYDDWSVSPSFPRPDDWSVQRSFSISDDWTCDDGWN